MTRGDGGYTASELRACFVRLSVFNSVAPNGVLLLANSSQEISCAKLVFGLRQRLVPLDITTSVRIAPPFDWVDELDYPREVSVLTYIINMAAVKRLCYLNELAGWPTTEIDGLMFDDERPVNHEERNPGKTQVTNVRKKKKKLEWNSILHSTNKDGFAVLIDSSV